MTTTKQQTAISTAAAVRRINRQLVKDGQMLRKTRGLRLQLDCGQYHVHEFSRNIILDTRVDPEALARELNVLRDDERVAEEAE